ncbi:DUF3072 domain-containing protein [Dietzia sp. UCD-THP]|uniref:DUF3072 domain-containing protein n=1 Tax=Dietzia sp. UCD-THP TaxID=1292020 RepID=UPI0004CF0D01|nr:DUF3072 domain-containing protein [Dietzia sp. UCD-THP]
MTNSGPNPNRDFGDETPGEQETRGAPVRERRTTGDNSLSRGPDDWVTGDEHMTQSQKSYLDTLAREADEEFPATLTRAEASEHIDRLQNGNPQID